MTSDADLVARQLGRSPRGSVTCAHRCECGAPDVISVDPRLPDGSPFPTFYYLTCPVLNSAIGTIEASGVMLDLSAELAENEEQAAQYQAAHDDYVSRREAVAVVSEIAGVSAGGMPNRVKCLHALVAHSLAVGPGINPIGDRVLTWLAEGRYADVSNRGVAGFSCCRD